MAGQLEKIMITSAGNPTADKARPSNVATVRACPLVSSFTFLDGWVACFKNHNT
jgi:hypothetical protein